MNKFKTGDTVIRTEECLGDHSPPWMYTQLGVVDYSPLQSLTRVQWEDTDHWCSESTRNLELSSREHLEHGDHSGRWLLKARAHKREVQVLEAEKAMLEGGIAYHVVKAEDLVREHAEQAMADGDTETMRLIKDALPHGVLWERIVYMLRNEAFR